MAQYNALILAILDKIVTDLKASTANYLKDVEPEAIERGMRSIETMEWPGIYVDINSSAHDEDSFATTEGKFHILIVVTEKDPDPKTCQTIHLNLIGAVFNAIHKLSKTQLGGLVRNCHCEEIIYNSRGIGLSATKRLGYMEFVADQSFVVS